MIRTCQLTALVAMFFFLSSRSHPSYAELISIRYRARVVDGFVDRGGEHALPLGIELDGLLTYETESLPSRIDGNSASYTEAIKAHEITILGKTFRQGVDSGLRVYNDSTGGDALTNLNSNFNPSTKINGFRMNQAAFTFFDLTSEVFTSTDLPTSLNFDSFGEKYYLIEFANQDGTNYPLYVIEQLVLIPEPTTATLLLTCIAPALLRRRR